MMSALRHAMAHPRPPRKKRYANFTDAELQYIYLQCDFDADKKVFRRIEKKIRRQIRKYREFDRARPKPSEQKGK